MAVHEDWYSATELTQQDGPHRRETFQVHELAAKGVDHTEQAFNFDAAKAPLPPSATDPMPYFNVTDGRARLRAALGICGEYSRDHAAHTAFLRTQSKPRAILIRISSARKLSSSMDMLVVENANAPIKEVIAGATLHPSVRMPRVSCSLSHW
jgi:hypothetical protein